MSWYAESREQKREDKRLAAELALKEREQERAFQLQSQEQEADQARQDREATERRKAERQERRRARRRELLETVTANKVALSIYGIALVSFVMSAPAMADYGRRIYAGSAWPLTGWLLPIVTELAMWACAFAVHHRRRTAPGTSVFWLQVGVALATALAAALNAMKGITVGWDASVVMGVVSIAGVLLHQMTVAGEPRTRRERDAGRIERRIDRKVRKARQAAIADAAVEIDAEGKATLVFEPGVYRVGRECGRRLRPEASPLDRPGPRDALDDELAALIDAETARTAEGETGAGGGVATLEKPAPETGAKGKKPGKTPSRRGGRQTRTLDDLRAELDALITRKPEAASWSKSRIARELGCDKRRASVLWDERHADH